MHLTGLQIHKRAEKSGNALLEKLSAAIFLNGTMNFCIHSASIAYIFLMHFLMQSSAAMVVAHYFSIAMQLDEQCV